MADGAQVQTMQDWAAAAFGRQQTKPADDGIAIEVRRQDHNTLHFGESCMETPMQIGKRVFQHGLGTHANSELVVTVPKGAVKFKSLVGVDNNYDTQGVRGSVKFAVKVQDKELVRTATLTGKDDAVAVEVSLPKDATQIVLIVDTTEDGPGWDQADWADAQFVMADGSVRWLDEKHGGTLLRDTSVPFSFMYGGVSSSKLLPTWKHAATATDTPYGVERQATWDDPKTGLRVQATVRVFNEYPAVDWLLHFENRGDRDTPIIEDVRTADVVVDAGNSKRPVVLHQLHGDACAESSFLPFDSQLDAGQNMTIAPARGRPSQESAFPFWNLQYRDAGLITAIGWSGQWSASYERANSGVLKFRAGMEKTHLLLHPGEKIRTPRVLLMAWKGDLRAAHNRFRRLMLFGYVPQLDGRPLRLPTVLQTFDRYIGRPDWATEAGQLQAVEAAHRLGFDTYWFDAGWFPGGFPAGAGNWFVKPKEFPNSLKPIGDLCHNYGMKFVVWFEPCRVAPDTQISREFPQFVLGGKDGGLFNLGDEAARRWLTDLISKRITEFALDVYREDYNIDPLDFWRKNDAPDRQGMTEIRFVEGHYLFWDELRSRHPGLWIDNCASGGRRIDLETCMRSVPLWRSDTSCSPGHPEWNQMQSAAIGQYIPLHTASVWEPQRYAFRSSGTGGLLSESDYLNPEYPADQARAVLAEIQENQKYWYGDFYPLSPVNTALDQFAAFQFHRSDLDAGIVLAFRRPQCDLIGVILSIHALTAGTTYEFDFIDEAGVKTTRAMTGREVETNGLDLRIPARGQSLLVRYRAKQAQ